jgi:hypothetical protein
MATSDILNIWNNAVGNLGVKSSIASLTEQSAEAAACALNYQSIIQDFARETDWNALRMTVALDDITADFTPPARWAFRYAFPTNCMALRRIENPTGALWTWAPIPPPMQGFEIAMDLDPDASNVPTKYLYSNYDSLSAIFTAFEYDISAGDYEALFDPSMVTAAGWALAAAIAGPLTGNAQIMQSARAEAMRSRDEARTANGNEGGITSMDAFPAESLTVRGFDDNMPYGWPLGRLLP